MSKREVKLGSGQKRPGTQRLQSRFTPRVIAVLMIQLIIFLGWTFYWMVQAEYRSLIEERKRALAQRIGIAYSVAASLNREVELGKQVRNQAITHAQQGISRLSYGEHGQGFFYVLDTSGNMVVNPLRPDLVGLNVTQGEDQNLASVVNEILIQARGSPTGYFDYKWKWTGTAEPPGKTGYYRRFDPWNWVIVSDFSPDEIRTDMVEYAGEKIIILLVLTAALAFVISTTLRRLVLTSVDRLIETAGKLQGGDLSARVAVSPMDEMRHLSEAFNQMAVEVQERNRQIRHAQRASVFALAKLAEARDNETGGHLLRVREYAAVLAEKLSKLHPWNEWIDRQFISDLFDAVMLHDIGKVGIPDSILLKPAGLTQEEKIQMMQHTIIGADTIRVARRQMNAESSFLEMAEQIARNHHERWDGNGYSQGLAREAIPLEARIFTIADVYDALTTKRPYKLAFTHEDAVRQMMEEQGIRFDPQIFDVFIESGEEFNRIRQEFADERIEEE